MPIAMSEFVLTFINQDDTNIDDIVDRRCLNFLFMMFII